MPSPLSARIAGPALALVAVLVVTVAGPNSGWAQSGGADERVVLDPHMRVLAHADLAAEQRQTLHRAMARGARQWPAEPQSVELITSAQVAETVAGAGLYEGTLELAREWGSMGEEAYKQVRTQEAVEYLERSLQNYESIGHDLVDPAEVAEVLMYLALSYLEEGTNVMRPIEVLQKMARLDPSRRLERGYYPDFIVQYYESARDDLWRRLRDEGPPIDQARQLAELMDGDYVFFAYLAPVDNGPGEQVVAYLYDRGEDEFLEPERLRLAELGEAGLEEGMGRLASRFAACLVDAPAVTNGDPGALEASRGTSRVAVEMALNYGSFLQVPTPLQESFGNYGIGLGISWSVTREFEVLGTLSVANSMRDYSGRLRDNFVTLRAFSGLRLGRQFGPIYLGLGAGVELTRLGPVQLFSDPSCIADPDQICPGQEGTVVYDDQGLYWGIQLRPRLAWSVANSFQVWSGLSGGYYFAPLEGELFNFPLTTEIGVKYRF